MKFAQTEEQREEIDMKLEAPIVVASSRRRRKRKGKRDVPVAETSELEDFRMVASELGEL